MLDQERIYSILELLKLFDNSDKIASNLVQNFFRSRKDMGSKDRKFVSNSFWNILRHRSKIDWHLTSLGIEITNEKKILLELKDKKESVVLIRGIVEDKQQVTEFNNILIYNYMTSKELETAINSSQLVVSRSGYTTIMDLAKLEKKAVFIPTPGQFEQLYLSEKLSQEKIVSSIKQEAFSYSDLKWNKNYSGFSKMDSEIDYKKLFSLF